MSGIELRYKDLLQLERWLQRAGRDTRPMLKRIHTRMGGVVKKRAQLYAPKSPTDAERRSVSKASKAQWNAAKKRRSKTATSRTVPGALQNSIELNVTHNIAEVFVPINSPAGAYAWKIHEEKGVSWQNRGIGTIKKGSQADDKFIERAIEDSEMDLVAIMDNEIEKMRRMI